jgi:hypothetical protein
MTIVAGTGAFGGSSNVIGVGFFESVDCVFSVVGPIYLDFKVRYLM